LLICRTGSYNRCSSFSFTSQLSFEASLDPQGSEIQNDNTGLHHVVVVVGVAFPESLYVSKHPTLSPEFPCVRSVYQLPTSGSHHRARQGRPRPTPEGHFSLFCFVQRRRKRVATTDDGSAESKACIPGQRIISSAPKASFSVSLSALSSKRRPKSKEHVVPVLTYTPDLATPRSFASLQPRIRLCCPSNAADKTPHVLPLSRAVSQIYMLQNILSLPLYTSSLVGSWY
jgi:hypothetical protein